MLNVQLLAAENESLLDGWNAFLLFDPLFYRVDLGLLGGIREGPVSAYLVTNLAVVTALSVVTALDVVTKLDVVTSLDVVIRLGVVNSLVVFRLDVNLDLLASECANPILLAWTQLENA